MAAPETQSAPAAAQAPQVRKAPEALRVILGIKRGMTQIFTEDGRLCGVTEVEAGPCAVLRVRTPEKDGYRAVQLGFGAVSEDRLSKPLAGQFKAVGLPTMRYLKEIRVADVKGFESGQVVELDGRFASGDYVDVQGISKGKGFAGVMKRHGFHGLPASHGASDKERSPGSLAARRSLGRVLPGQRMAGHMGNVTVTVQKLEVIQVDSPRHRIYLFGSVPGPVGCPVVVAQTVKGRKRRIAVKREAVLRDKMGNIITGKGAKARALAEVKAKAATKPAAKK
ncbi:MAG: 50S ribosomal protein L3 [Elusimicrobia bacterium]|nr:50S ribosomal protein L3 [Elusimicrobiota bacterium]